jgi:hypothetical protein
MINLTSFAYHFIAIEMIIILRDIKYFNFLVLLLFIVYIYCITLAKFFNHIISVNLKFLYFRLIF